MSRTVALPSVIANVEQLEDLLSEPSPGAIETMARWQGDVMILGVGGKMGPTLARMARRATEAAGVTRRIIGVSRFSNGPLEEQLRSHGIETIRCDLLDAEQVERLPDAPLVIAMTGMKFGATDNAALTWGMNAYLPALICRKFRQSRIVAFSSGNIYGLTPVRLGGSLESDPLQPFGEYAMSLMGRERMYEYFSQLYDIPMAFIRLNYATETRYGVLVDLAQRVAAGQPVSLDMGHLNAIWQGDANAMSLCAFDHAAVPPWLVNIAGPETLSVRRLATRLGELMKRSVTFTGSESADAFLSNAQQSFHLFGYPRVSVEHMLRWIADWVQRGGATLGKPTHFEVRDGNY
ncbi:MAG: NAD-dependent epimerase/dehydratase family protein [Gemmataceae bacterium]